MNAEPKTNKKDKNYLKYEISKLNNNYINSNKIKAHRRILTNIGDLKIKKYYIKKPPSSNLLSQISQIKGKINYKKINNISKNVNIYPFIWLI